MRTEPELGPLSFGPKTADGKRWCRCGHGEHVGICGATSRVKTEGVFPEKVTSILAHAPCDCYEFEPIVYGPCGGFWLPGWDARPGKHHDGSPYPGWPGAGPPMALTVPVHLVTEIDKWMRGVIEELCAKVEGETSSTQYGRNLSRQLTSLMRAAKIDST